MCVSYFALVQSIHNNNKNNNNYDLQVVGIQICPAATGVKTDPQKKGAHVVVIKEDKECKNEQRQRYESLTVESPVSFPPDLGTSAALGI